MKKWLKWLVLPVCLFVVSPIWGQSLSNDSSKSMSYYSTYGFSAGATVKQAADYSTVDDSLMVSGLAAIWAAANTNATKAQLERRVMTVSIGTQDAGIDTIWTQLFTVPAGQTYTVTEMILSAHTEGDEATDTLHCGIYYYLGEAKATLDTAVAQFCVDNDSSIVYADTIYTMTLVDSVFTAGDIVSCWWMGPGGAMTEGEGAAITIEYILDE